MPASDAVATLAQTVVDLARDRELTLTTAESCTAGEVAAALARADGATASFAGGVVAYRPDVKQRLLGVRPGPVICAEAVAQMALGARAQVGGDIAVATSGVFGHDEIEGAESGTLWIAVAGPDDRTVGTVERRIEPPDAMPAFVRAALEELARRLRADG